MGDFEAVPRVKGADQEHQYIHLVRLAWDLRMLGAETRIELTPSSEPLLVVDRAAGLLLVRALHHCGMWFFTWGRGRSQRVRALADDAAERIWEVGQ